MEDHNLLDGKYSPEKFAVSEEAKIYLKETGKWAKFLAIVAIIFIGLMVIFSLMIGGIMQTAMLSTGQDLPFPTIFITLFYLLMSGLFIPPTIYLFKFANFTKSAVMTESTQNLTEAMANLKSVFKYYGIFTIVTLCLYALMFILMIASAFFIGTQAIY